MSRGSQWLPHFSSGIMCPLCLTGYISMKKTPLIVRKAVLPVAGLGTRMLPATKAIPKEMLPVVDKPLIQYVVREAIAAGIKEIILVTHSSKNSIENHFDKSFELEATLEKRVKRQLLEEVQQICPKDVTIMHVRQGEAKGLGHAVLCARPLIGDNPFAVLLPDVLIDEMASDLKQDNLAEMVHLFEADQISQIMVETVPQSEVDKYGIADVKGEELTAGMSLPMQAIVEKPPRDEAPSNLAVVGRYVLSANIWPLLEKTPAGAGDEIQLTDAIAMLMEREQVNAYSMKGRSHDCGSKLGYMKANVEYAARHGELGAEFRQWLAQFAKQL
jgi:UTP--glucose-1-phosphate uridylyltransferase